MTPTYPVRAKIVGHRSMQEFAERFADPLYHALRAHGYGDITGGNGQHDATGRAFEWFSIDIRLVDLDVALEFTRRTLHDFGAPAGSELEYTVAGQTRVTPVDDPTRV